MLNNQPKAALQAATILVAMASVNSMMNLFLLHGKTCVQFWHKDLRIAASNSLSGHFENSGGRNWGEPKLLPAGVDLHPGHPDRNS